MLTKNIDHTRGFDLSARVVRTKFEQSNLKIAILLETIPIWQTKLSWARWARHQLCINHLLFFLFFFLKQPVNETCIFVQKSTARTMPLGLFGPFPSTCSCLCSISQLTLVNTNPSQPSSYLADSLSPSFNPL